MEMKQWHSGTAKSLKKAGNLNRWTDTCLKCYNVEDLNAETSPFLADRWVMSYVNLAENKKMINSGCL